MKQKSIVTHRYTVLLETIKNLDSFLTDQHSSLLRFYGTLRGRNFWGARHFVRRCVCNPAVY